MDFGFRRSLTRLMMIIVYAAYSKEEPTFNVYSTLEEPFALVSAPKDSLVEFSSRLEEQFILVLAPKDSLDEFLSRLEKPFVLVLAPKDSLDEFLSRLEKPFVLVLAPKDSLDEFLSRLKEPFVLVLAPKDSLGEFFSRLEEPFVISFLQNDSLVKLLSLLENPATAFFRLDYTVSWIKLFAYIVVIPTILIIWLKVYGLPLRSEEKKNNIYFKSHFPRKLVMTPAYQSDGAGGFDLRCVQEFSVECNSVAFVDTGLSFEIPEGHAGFVKGRSSMAKRGLWCYEGLIDSDYRGIVSVLLYNISGERITMAAGSRIAQMVIMKVERPNIVKSRLLSDTKRGSGAFGSTGDGTND